MATKPTPARKASGKSIQEWQRTTARLVVRCSPELAARARRVGEERDVTLAQLLESGVRSAEAERDLAKRYG